MTGTPDPFQNRAPDAHTGGRPFATFLERLREVQDLVAQAAPPEDVLAEAEAALARVGDLLRPWAAPESRVPPGHRLDLPGRGNPLLPPFLIDEETADTVRGRVRFTPYFVGGNHAAHGGALPLFFDDILGRLSNAHGRAPARTAYLHVNYRRITPIGPELSFDARIDREEGRKRFLSGVLHDAGGHVVADADGLFVVLLPGQP